MPITSLIIFLISLALRVWEVAYPINVDEALWMYRGSSFIQKILAEDWAGTYLRHHPGVTNMWLIGTGHLLSSGIYSVFPDWLGVDQVPYRHSCFSSFSCLIALWIVPRLLQALFTSACMVFIYQLAKKLWGQAIAVMAISLLVLEPFFLAYQRFITTDALQADFSIISLLLLMLYLQGKGRWFYLITSGICFGLAIASKIPALFISFAVVIWIILIELGIWQSSFPRRGWKRQTIDLALWGFTALIIIILIWPTLWVNPGETLQRIYADLQEESARGDLFFMGENTTPGLSFYPLTLVYRLSPVLQLGVIASLIALVIPSFRAKHHPEITALVIVVLVTLVMFSTSDSKIDRYIVVIVPELAILAAIGYQIAYQKIWQWLKFGRETLNKKNTYTVLLFLTVIQASILVALSPQYVSYYNPLFGGASVGQNLFHIGIGEGLDQAAQWLNQLPNSSSLTAASWYRLGFAPYFKGTAIEGWSTNQANLLKANYVLIYVNQKQRNLPTKNFVTYFLRQKPLHTISLAGLDYVNIYPGLAPLPQELEEIEYPTSVTFGEKVRLIGYSVDDSQLTSANKLSITCYWEFLQSLPTDWQITFNDQFQNRQVNLVNGYLPISKIPSGTILRDVQQLDVGENFVAADYQLKIGWVTSNQKQVAVTDQTDQVLDNQFAIAKLAIK